MIIYINDKPCETKVGDLLLSVAQQHKSHIGYICGGNGICQSCFVYVKEGAECLSDPGEEEKTFISARLLNEGGRLACRTIIKKEGRISVLSRAENLRRIVVGLNVPGFITYARTIGYNVVNQLPGGAVNVFTRVRDGRINPAKTLGKIGDGLGHASLLVMHTFLETFPFMQGPATMASEGFNGIADTASKAICSLPVLSTIVCRKNEADKLPLVETIKITTK
ncbi:MAG: 2Fe-2S iron-sulfur cluster binding domain-containing protein [Chlorobiaceae bacterium]|nr:2Fe-2S iron-sulfur cluster binding domain-containing protein [Chlorobiaceae bacterium]NTW63448.1 2Fe-2S iron-sulfur cluster binding domain-containing protein [Chlorobiaceae bacterium]